MRKPATTDSTDDTVRRPGRPRSARADRAILEAAVELLVEVGFGGMTVEAIAARAQVGKATIYRRWTSKDEIVTEALRSLTDSVQVPDTGNTHEDLLVLMRGFHSAIATSDIGQMLGRVVSAAIGNPEFMHIFWKNMILPRRSAVKEILLRGQERGDVRTDLDLELALDMIPGTILYRKLISGHSVDQLITIPEELINIFWAGLSVEGTTPERKTPRC